MVLCDFGQKKKTKVRTKVCTEHISIVTLQDIHTYDACIAPILYTSDMICRLSIASHARVGQRKED